MPAGEEGCLEPLYPTIFLSQAPTQARIRQAAPTAPRATPTIGGVAPAMFALPMIQTLVKVPSQPLMNKTQTDMVITALNICGISLLLLVLFCT
jgi:hypothetical protein